MNKGYKKMNLFFFISEQYLNNFCYLYINWWYNLFLNFDETIIILNTLHKYTEMLEITWLKLQFWKVNAFATSCISNKFFPNILEKTQ